ncbi:MAG TPA: IPT/TIG domain-containing protein, partial [Candidatus Limnocylindria bacterium]|nr:IPT/TIG domain-containing protein [Candidatus Limnocylindria bacterium]
APASGPAGTDVIVTGTGFAAATGVTFNGQAASFTAASDTLLHATAPASAGSGTIAVTNPGGTATSTQSFTVLLPPVITSFAPTSGPAGTEVTINGSEFGGILSVTFNGSAATFIVDSPIRVRATVPSGASTGRIAVTNPDGVARTNTDFTVIQPPTIASFAPVSGPAGTDVIVTGTGLATATGVTFNGKAASFTAASDTLLHATAPAGAGSGTIAVTNPAGTATTADSFYLLLPPVITSFSPTSGPAGAEVTIDGSELGGILGVTFNGSAATFIVDSPIRVRATVPSGATTGRIAATNTDGTGLSATDFTVLLPPSIASFAPASGPVGAIVTINGGNFAGVTGVTFNGVAATTFAVQSSTLIDATVPFSATTGRIAVATPGGTTQSATDFVVTPSGPTSFQPIHDAHVNLGSPSTNYGGLDHLRVRSGSGSYNSYLKFDLSGVTQPVQSAKLRLFCTDDSPDGGTVYLVSNNYASTSTPWLETGLNWTNSPAFGATSIAPSQAVGLNAWVEYDVTSAITGSGIYSLAIRSNATNSAYYTSKEGVNQPALVIQTASGPPVAPTITSFTPASGPVGAEVTIDGAEFVGVTGVTFNGVAATSFTVETPSRLRATVPAGATTGRIAVTNPHGSGQSGTDFIVAGPPSTLSFSPSHDAHVNSGSTSGNYGALDHLRVRSGSYNSYLKFDLTGITQTVQSAKLRLFCTDDSPDGGAIYLVSNNYAGGATPWLESGLTWSNSPAFGATPITPSQAAGLNVWVEYDVTVAITGNGTYSFGIRSASTNSTYYSSTEGAQPPALVLTLASSLAMLDPTDRTSTALEQVPVVDPAPTRLALRAYPSPSRGPTSFAYAAPRPGTLRLSVFDVRGRRVWSLSTEIATAGSGRCEWNGRDGEGRALPTGVYLYRYELGAESGIGKLTLLR